MPRQKSGNFDQKQYVNDFVRTKVIYRRMNFNVRKQDEMLMAAWIDNQKAGVSNYLKHLVEEDMKSADPVLIQQLKILVASDPKYQEKELSTARQ